jgi:acyl carrier protein
MENGTIKQHLRKFLAETLVKEQTGDSIQDSDSFLENEMIDSTGVLELVLFIEETFGFAVEDEEIVPENLDSINRVIAYVQSRLTKSGAKI